MKNLITFLNKYKLRVGSLVISFLLLLLFFSGSLSRLDSMALDLQFRLLSIEQKYESRNEVVVVGIDDASLKELSVPLAILHRQLGSFFEATALGRARGVGVDIVLPEVSFDHIQPGLDVAMASGIVSLRAVAPLVVGLTADAQGQLRKIHPLFSTLVGPEGTGMVLVIKDTDGFVRRFDERIGTDQQELISMPGRLARRLGAQPVNGIVPFHLGSPMSFIPFSEVLQLRASGNVEELQKRFSGKVVLLGSVLDYDDIHPVPIALATGDSADATHGVFILARQLQALLDGNLIQEIPFNVGLLFILMATLTWWLHPSKKVYLCTAFGTLAMFAASLYLLAAGWAVPVGSITLAIAIGLASRSILFSIENAAERRHLKSAFGGFVSPDVLTEIMSGRLDANLNGERKTICILFSDIRNFTTLSEKMAPEVVTKFLNSYFELMVGCIHQNGGTVDKFMGDGIMAFFGAPRDVSNPCEDAFNASKMMLVELEKLNQDWQKENHEKISIGIGLNYGPAYLGYIGSKDRHEYSAIGDSVNLTARVEGLTKDSGYPIMVTSSVRDALPHIEGFVDLGMKPVKGRSDAQVYGWKL